MSDKALSSLTDAGAIASGDIGYAIRGGNSRRVDLDEFASGITSPVVTGGAAVSSTLTLKSTSGIGTSDAIKFETGSAAERMRIDTNGVVTLTGKAGSITPTFNDTPLQVHVGDATNTDAAVAWFYWANDLTGPKETFFKSRGVTPNTYTVVQADDILGGLEFFGADGTDFAEAARIQAHVDGTPGAGDMPGRLVFKTSADGVETSVERVRIDRQGRVTLWGSETEAGATPSPTFASIPLQIHVGVANSGNAEALLHWGADANSAVLQFYKGRGGAVGTTTIVQDGDRLGSILFSGEDGSDNARSAAFIQARVDGTPGASDMPGRLMFFTTPDGSATLAERMRINNAGDVSIGIAASASGQLHVDQPSTTGAQPVLYLDQADIDQPFATLATTIGTGNAIEAVGAKTLTTTHFVMVNIDGVGNRYIPVGTIA